jgi:Domain of unknown function (DUF1707)
MGGVDGMEDAAPEKRIGDRERREVDDHLRQAHADGVLTLGEYDERTAQCWAARTRRDLDVLVRDLPDHRPGSALDQPTAPPDGTVSPTGKPRRHIGRAVVVGLALLFGAQIITADDAVGIFSGQVVQVTPGQERVEVGVLFGGVEVVVPDDARVDTDGLVVFGGTDCDAACNGTGTRPVTVSARGAFGGVEVVRQSERAQRDADRDEEDDD